MNKRLTRKPVTALIQGGQNRLSRYGGTTIRILHGTPIEQCVRIPCQIANQPTTTVDALPNPVLSWGKLEITTDPVQKDVIYNAKKETKKNAPLVQITLDLLANCGI